jgi:hypothetical protein
LLKTQKKRIKNAKGIDIMNAAEIKEIIIAIFMLISVTVLGCLKIVNGESITWIIGMVAGYVWGTGKSKIELKNNTSNN